MDKGLGAIILRKYSFGVLLALLGLVSFCIWCVYDSELLWRHVEPEIPKIASLGDTFVNSCGIEMAWVPDQSLGTNGGFWLSTEKVPKSSYSKLVGEDPSDFSLFSSDINNVSYQDAIDFIRRLNREEKQFLVKYGLTYRLPFEYETRQAHRVFLKYGKLSKLNFDIAPNDRNAPMQNCYLEWNECSEKCTRRDVLFEHRARQLITLAYKNQSVVECIVDRSIKVAGKVVSFRVVLSK